MENREYAVDRDEAEKVEYYEDWKHFGNSEGSDDEWDQYVENVQKSLWTR